MKDSIQSLLSMDLDRLTHHSVNRALHRHTFQIHIKTTSKPLEAALYSR
jgi:hypothetical protein